MDWEDSSSIQDNLEEISNKTNNNLFTKSLSFHKIVSSEIKTWKKKEFVEISQIWKKTIEKKTEQKIFDYSFINKDNYVPSRVVNFEKRNWYQMCKNFDQEFTNIKKPLEKKKVIFSTVWQQFIPIYEVIGEDLDVNFLVDLDSILVEILLAPQLDFKYGLQTLSIIHCVERRIQMLKIGGRKPIIVSFNFVKCILWNNESSQIYLLRKIILMHLQSLPDLFVYLFEDFWSQDWCNFIKNWLPNFIIISGPGAKVFSREHDYVWESLSIYLNCCQSIPVVFSSKLGQKSNALLGHKIYTSVRIKKFCQNYFGKFQTGFINIPSNVFGVKLCNDPILWKKVCACSSTPIEQCLIYSLARILIEDRKKTYCVLILLNYTLTRLLPLECRRIILHRAPYPKLNKFNERLYLNLEHTLKKFDDQMTDVQNSLQNISKQVDKKILEVLDFTDLLDSRFLYGINEKNCECDQDLGFDIALKSLKNVWANLLKLTKILIPLFPFLETEELNVSLLNRKNNKQLVKKQEKHAFVQIDVHFINSDIFIHLEKNLLKKNLLEKVKDPPNSKFWKIIKEEFNAEWIPDKKIQDGIHWHPVPKTVKVYYSLEIIYINTFKIQEKRNAQNFITFIEKYCIFSLNFKN